MQMDWFTFIAQIVNFLLLIGLLRHFLYRPITTAMDEREARIAARLNEARAQQEAAAAEAAAYQAQQATLAAERDALLAEASAEAEALRKQLLHDAHTHIDALETRWREALRSQQDAFLSSLSQQSADLLLITARRALEDLAHAPLEDQVVAVFLERLQSLDAQEKQTLALIGHASDTVPVVRTHFALTEAVQLRICQAWQAQVGDAVTPAFETTPDVGFGIELRGGGLKVGWSLASYLATLEERVTQALEEALLTHAGAAPTPAPLPDAVEAPEASP